MTTQPTPEPPPNTPVKEIGEFGLLGLVLPGLPSAPAVLVGPGDDAAVCSVEGDIVMSTDVLVEGVHFRRDWSGPIDIGRKAVAVNVSDLNAMGAEPVALVMALSLPGETTLGWVQEFIAGVVAECERCGVTLVGGDTTRSRDITVAVTVLGQTAGRRPVLRNGAAAGDVVAVCGRLGWAAAGLAVLGRGFRSPRAVVEAQRVPTPPYGQGVVAADAGATSMIDVSDGLLQDLGHLAERSRVRIDLDPGALEIGEPLRAVAAASGKDPLTFVLTGGEDHALVATFPSRRDVPPQWQVIGDVLPADAGAEPSVTVSGASYDGTGGWDHFG